jgi:hypothetical protein
MLAQFKIVAQARDRQEEYSQHDNSQNLRPPSIHIVTRVRGRGFETRSWRSKWLWLAFDCFTLLQRPFRVQVQVRDPWSLAPDP